jgi:DUF218 domain
VLFEIFEQHLLLKNEKTMKKLQFISTILIFLTYNMIAQQGKGYQKDYVFLKSNNLVVDKNFYLLTVIEKSETVKNALINEPLLKKMKAQKTEILKNHVNDTCTTPTSLLIDFKISPSDSTYLDSIQRQLYKNNATAFDALINTHLRPSGAYQRFTNDTNLDLWLKTWGQYAVGINYIIDQFGFGKKMRYPRIDSASYDVNSRYYRVVLKDIMAVLDEKTSEMSLFFQPSLSIAMRLMEANDRDEPARHEPMEQKDNQAAFQEAQKTNWQKYKYAAIVVPGNGPELSHTPLSPLNKMRLDFVAERFYKGFAPFIIVSGGYCYPYKTTHAEAVEMKNYLMTKHKIAAKNIIIDPHARHTTTNYRNANRLMIRYGFPLDKLCLFTTTKSQTDYVMNSLFDKRNENELGYLPYIGKKRISSHDIEYLPNILCLHLDPFDPLDP